jgi:sulfur carrier protein
LEVEEGARYSEVLSSLGINPETVVIVKDNLPVPTDDVVEEGEVVVMRVISGG